MEKLQDLLNDKEHETRCSDGSAGVLDCHPPMESIMGEPRSAEPELPSDNAWTGCRRQLGSSPRR